MIHIARTIFVAFFILLVWFTTTPSAAFDLPSFENVSTGVQVFAVLAGVLLGLYEFVYQRRRYPRARITHTAWAEPIPNQNLMLLHLVATLENVGHVAIRLHDADLRVEQVLPPDERAAAFLEEHGTLPLVAGRAEAHREVLATTNIEEAWKNKPPHIEPGETDSFHADFAIPNSIELVAVYSYFRNITNRTRDIGWDETSFVSLIQQNNLRGGQRDRQERAGT